MTNIQTDLIFDPEQNLAFDLYEPSNPNEKILIFWHGGGWFRGDKDSLVDLATKIAEDGFLTFVPNYRLAPRYTFPSANDDALKFVSWLTQSNYYKVGQEIVQIGASVGGTMALQISMKYEFKTVTWSAPLNFSNWMDEHREVISSVDAKNDFEETDPKKIHDSFYKYFVSTYIGDPITQEKLKALDITSHFDNQIGDLMMFNSTAELVPLRDTLNFIDTLAKKDVPVTLQTVAGDGHAMDYAANVLDLSLSYLEI